MSRSWYSAPTADRAIANIMREERRKERRLREEQERLEREARRKAGQALRDAARREPPVR